MRPTHNKPKTADVQRTVSEKRSSYEKSHTKAIKALQQKRVTDKQNAAK